MHIEAWQPCFNSIIMTYFRSMHVSSLQKDIWEAIIGILWIISHTHVNPLSNVMYIHTRVWLQSVILHNSISMRLMGCIAKLIIIISVLSLSAEFWKCHAANWSNNTLTGKWNENWLPEVNITKFNYTSVTIT